MMRSVLILLMVLGGTAQPAQSQQRTRIAVGVASAHLGDAGRAFDNLVTGFAQVAPGLQAQRAYPAWWMLEAGASVPLGPVDVGARAQGRWTQADALYGDYAGTVDVVGRTRALVGEAEASIPLGPERVRAGAHVGAVVTSTRLTADAVATLDGQTEQSRYRLTGTGVGPTAGASLHARLPMGAAAVSARLGVRWGQVRRLNAQESTPTSQTSGQLRLVHGFSGVSFTLGVEL